MGQPWLLFVPLLAILVLGSQATYIWLGIVLITWIGYYGIELTGTDFHRQVDLSGISMELQRLLEALVLTSVVFGVIFLNRRIQNWLYESLQEKEQETRAVVETAPDGILTVNAQGEILATNQAATVVFGRPEEEILSLALTELVPTLPGPPGELFAREVYKTGLRREEKGLRDQKEFPLELAFGQLTSKKIDSKTLTPLFVAVLRDITQRKEDEELLKEARDQAMASSRAKSAFLANMSHELRTPLNAVIGYSEMIIEEIEILHDSDKEDADIVEAFVPDLTRIRNAGRHLLLLINDILDLSKIEAGKMSVHAEKIDLPSLMEDILATIQPLASQNNNAVEVDIDPAVQTLRTDSTKVRQILFNLLSNACKFTKQGTVLVATRRLENSQIEITVKDSGIGMSAEQLEKIFDAFQQADSSTTREYGGTGLGLTITRRFIELLGGTLEVESRTDEGSTFRVTLPINLLDSPEVILTSEEITSSSQ